ncbi:alpha/beta hydrolase [Bradyrhizobium jicamae]|uniref:Alpha/beta hydrolase n=1 Tax=Bradyrhizobium jicamae TaxID=280332 RepID=A0ABS5FGD7_9BRAD|nr:alpha/beta hydrolase [Bradyrhizobium jicamae]MBR0795744.1 alpha/beta hydrolase [Bradyrhizobium jicamae]MBR0933767.1 alpha/beta hydrolase [Bradyrhizobium jicamae]
MPLHRIEDWDDAYRNGAHIPGGADYPERWLRSASAFRESAVAEGRASLDIAYGRHERQRLDLFLPKGTPKGLVVFVHGGFWMAFDKNSWSHLARGAVELGYAVALPSYRLAPEARIGEIVSDIAAAIDHVAGEVGGPITLTGHSAGGHLVTRQMCATSTLQDSVAQRVGHVVSISGLHDLRPLMRTEMNRVLRIDDAEAARESPALLEPRHGFALSCYVGGAERNEFLRQNSLLQNIWTGSGIATQAIVAPDRHHFNVLDGMTDPEHMLTRLLVDTNPRAAHH